MHDGEDLGQITRYYLCEWRGVGENGRGGSRVEIGEIEEGLPFTNLGLEA